MIFNAVSRWMMAIVYFWTFGVSMNCRLERKQHVQRMAILQKAACMQCCARLLSLVGYVSVRYYNETLTIWPVCLFVSFICRRRFASRRCRTKTSVWYRPHNNSTYLGCMTVTATKANNTQRDVHHHGEVHVYELYAWMGSSAPTK